ncbi:MAG: hypothetical protein AUF67_09850 [Acidobacteria bacterium 13_1_20CM_58_21]|nr:MAG: hypothetical protein AUF67_09850 [Acidobacteria bacterium 13_1_20CM_58_21]
MGLAFLWCPVGGKFGRVRTQMLTIARYLANFAIGCKFGWHNIFAVGGLPAYARADRAGVDFAMVEDEHDRR